MPLENDIIQEKKCHFWPNFQFKSALIPEFAKRCELTPIWACTARRVLSEYTSHTRGSFLELAPSPWTNFQGVLNVYN